MSREILVETHLEAQLRESNQGFFIGKTHVPGVVTQMIIDRQKNVDKLDEYQVIALEALFNRYKKTKINVGDTIIQVEAGGYGHVEIKTIGECDKSDWIYPKGGDYKYITVKSLHDRMILWTDYEPIEPYNRQSPFYNGMSFSRMKLVKEGVYREFYASFKCDNITECGSSTFGMDGFYYNKYWDIVKFGIILKTKHVEAFMKQLRIILNKQLYVKPNNDIERIERYYLRNSGLWCRRRVLNKVFRSGNRVDRVLVPKKPFKDMI